MKNTISRMALTITALALTTPAFAIERVDTPQTTCANIQNILNRDGAAILRYPSKRVANYTLYDRYVSGDRFCKRDERAEPALVPSKDRANCHVRLCKTYEPIIDFFD
ncbi:hypothetical protein WNY59_09080 [Ahrensia kielensis]|uniref:Uncharacterized protein n=1 Tax=Ahrensia kielensis TaxID=76980 RepID=A0ABU9T6I8_9HYPH